MTAKCASKQEAREKGLTRYVSPTPCPAGHGHERLVSTGGCVECARNRRRASRRDNPRTERESMIRSQLKAYYGLSQVQYLQMYEKQSGKCAICARDITHRFDESRPIRRRNYGPDSRTARVDHEHTTGRVRGLLCTTCNTGLGQFKDSEQFLSNAIRYLRDTRAPGQANGREQHDTLQGAIEPISRDLGSSQRRGNRREQLSPFLN